MDVIRVVDVPGGTSELEAQRLLNVPCLENRYMLVQVLPMPGGAMRAVYRLLAKALDLNRNQRGVSNADGQDSEARDIIRANAKLTVRALVGKLDAHGIKRGKTWIAENRVLIREAARARPPG